MKHASLIIRICRVTMFVIDFVQRPGNCVPACSDTTTRDQHGADEVAANLAIIRLKSRHVSREQQLRAQALRLCWDGAARTCRCG